VTIIVGDCREVMAGMAEASVDAIVTDPPYGLSREPDVAEVMRHWLAGDTYDHGGGGFMGRTWDSFVPGPDYWREAYRVLRPGGHLLAFGGTRTFDLLSIALRMAGFQVRDVVCWLAGAGFPKSLDVSKAIDKMAGAHHLALGPGTSGKSRAVLNAASYPESFGGDYSITAPATPEAAQWTGWGTALKPAWEPVIVARKPLSSPGTNVLKVVEYQLRERGVVGDIRWTSRSAKPAARHDQPQSSTPTSQQPMAAMSADRANESEKHATETQTAMPLDASGENGQSGIRGGQKNTAAQPTVNSDPKSSPPTVADVVAAASTSLTSSHSITSTAEAHSTASQSTARSTPTSDETDTQPDTESFAGIATGLTGSTAHVLIRRLSDGSFLWPDNLPKSTAGEVQTLVSYQRGRQGGNDGWKRPWNQEGAEFEKRPAHTGRWPANVALDEAAAEMLDAQSGVSKSPATYTRKADGFGKAGYGPSVGQVAGTSSLNYGDSGGASRFFYCAKSSRRERNAGLEGMPERAGVDINKSQRIAHRNPDTGEVTYSEYRPSVYQNHHPTVKPIALMRWLVRLVTPPGGTVLDPFAGSGSTGCACALEGFAFIGIEQSAEYAEIAERRIAHWSKRPAVLQHALPLEGAAD
jgi:DNA modification methylase